MVVPWTSVDMNQDVATYILSCRIFEPLHAAARTLDNTQNKGTHVEGDPSRVLSWRV